MIEHTIIDTVYCGWFASGDIRVKGYCFSGNGQLLEGESLAAFFRVSSEQQLIERAREANGLFSVVGRLGDSVFALSDLSRIYPLYYRSEADTFTLTDCPDRLLRCGDCLSSSALRQYKVSGAPYPGLTLVEDVLTIPAGHLLLFDNERVNLREFAPYAVTQEQIREASPDALMACIEAAFSRMIASLHGRQVVLPLSGGYDSRLIACMFRKRGYDNVLCYTVGHPSSPDREMACRVAHTLGYPIHCFDFTDEDDVLRCPNIMDYMHRIGHLSNFVWLYDYSAVTALRASGLLRPDAVFIPGHSGDSIAGSHLQKGFVREHASARCLASSMLHLSYEYGYDRSLRPSLSSLFRDRIAQGYLPYSVYQEWIMRHRQACNIVNSARVYEFFGYDVRLPLWDAALVDMMRRLPFAQLYGCQLYRSTLDSHLFAPMGVTEHLLAPSPLRRRLSALRRLVRNYTPHALWHCFVHYTDPLGERELESGMLRQLISSGRYRSEHDALSVNAVMKDWYLMQVEQQLAALRHPER